jgi:uncharacterized protein
MRRKSNAHAHGRCDSVLDRTREHDVKGTASGAQRHPLAGAPLWLRAALSSSSTHITMTARWQVVLEVISVCCCLTAVKVGSQTPAASPPTSDTAASHARAAERLLVVTNAEKMMDDQTDQMLKNQIRDNPAIAATLSATQSIIRKYVNYTAIKPDMIKAYTATYSEDELNQIIAFYQTDVGRMMLERMPKILAQTQAITNERLKAAQPELIEAIRRSITGQL